MLSSSRPTESEHDITILRPTPARHNFLTTSMLPLLVRDSSPDTWYSPSTGITPDHSIPTSLQIFTVSVTTLAVYNALELIIMVLMTFRKYQGLYFYSLVGSGLAVIPYSVGFLLHLLNLTSGTSRWLAMILITIGWWPMVTGQSVVMWSRLHLIVVGTRGQNIIRWTRCMILVNAIVLHLPTTSR